MFLKLKSFLNPLQLVFGCIVCKKNPGWRQAQGCPQSLLRVNILDQAISDTFENDPNRLIG